MKIVIILTFSVFSLLFGQTNSNPIILPAPLIGWDSLQNLISYPEIAVRAHVEGAFRSTIEVDQNGQISSLETNCLNYEHANTSTDSLFIGWIENNIRSIHWLPGNDNGINQKLKIELAVIFYLTKENSKSFLKNRKAILIRGYNKGCVWPVQK